MSDTPQTYKYIDCPQLPQGFRAYAAKVKENFDWVASSVNKLVAQGKSFAAALAKKADSASPNFTGRLGLPVVAVAADPGNPPPGQAWALVLVDAGASAELVVRHNDAGTVRSVTIPLT